MILDKTRSKHHINKRLYVSKLKKKQIRRLILKQKILKGQSLGNETQFQNVIQQPYKASKTYKIN